MVHPKCKVCLSENTVHLFDSFNTHGRKIIDEEDKFQVFKCGDCGLVFLNDLEANQDYYDRYYQPDYYKDSCKNIGIFKSFLKVLSKFSTNRKQKIIFRSLKNKVNKPHLLLDIGCGTGEFLESLDSSKFDGYGCEVNESGYKSCIKKGLIVYKGELHNIDFRGKKFDVVTLWHVLEHIEDPVKLFRKIREILSKDGILLFQVPNTDSLGFRIGKEWWFHMDSPRHLALYNKKSLRELCKVTGFEITSVKNEFYDYPLDLFWSIRKSKLRFFIYPFYIIFKMLSKEHLTFICKKK